MMAGEAMTIHRRKYASEAFVCVRGCVVEEVIR